MPYTFQSFMSLLKILAFITGAIGALYLISGKKDGMPAFIFGLIVSTVKFVFKALSLIALVFIVALVRGAYRSMK